MFADFFVSMLWIKISIDVLSVLIWVQIDCKGSQQTIKVCTSKERIIILFPTVYVLLCKKIKKYIFYSFDLNENCMVVKLVH